MKQVVALVALLASLTAWAADVPELPTPGDAAAGEAKAATCIGCHGTDGNSLSSDFPKLAGQHAEYTAEQLAHFKSGERANALMAGFAAALSEQDMKDLAAYYEGQAVAVGVADAEVEVVERGEQIYRFGDPERGVAACIACHGPQGKGVASAKFPALAAQWADYTVTQLQAYQSGDRVNVMMNGVAANMREADMVAVAQYLQGLR